MTDNLDDLSMEELFVRLALPNLKNDPVYKIRLELLSRFAALVQVAGYRQHNETCIREKKNPVTKEYERSCSCGLDQAMREAGVK